jgi:hypothetical protein
LDAGSGIGSNKVVVRLLDLIFKGDPQWIAFLFV